MNGDAVEPTLRKIEAFIDGFFWVLPNLLLALVVFGLFLAGAWAAKRSVSHVARRQDRGDLRLHLDRSGITNREIANRLCMSIDVQHGEVFTAPDSNARRMNDVESACRFIAAVWPTV